MINKVKQLETLLREAENKISKLFREGKIPTPRDYADVDRIKKELKVARRVMTMGNSRIDPLLTERVAVRLSKDEYERLKRQAEEKGVSVSDRIRDIIRKTLT